MPQNQINLYEPRRMLAALVQRPTPQRFFRQTFFGSTITHETVTVELDIMKTKRRVAGYTAPEHAAKTVEREGFFTKTVRPAYIKEKTGLRVSDLRTRALGQSVYDPVSPIQRAAAMLGDDLRMLSERFDRREEIMCAQAILTGRIEIRGDGLDDVIDFGYIPNEHVMALSGTDCFDDPDSDPQRTLDEWVTLILKRCGIKPNHLICGTDVCWKLTDHPLIKERLDNRRVEMGQINPMRLPAGVRYWGHLNPPGLDIYSYDEWYTDPATGNDVALVPPDVVILGSDQARCAMHYGLIQNLKNPVAVPRFPSVWMENDGSAEWLQLESAPMPTLYQADAFIVAHVLEG